MIQHVGTQPAGRFAGCDAAATSASAFHTANSNRSAFKGKTSAALSLAVIEAGTWCNLLYPQSNAYSTEAVVLVILVVVAAAEAAAAVVVAVLLLLVVVVARVSSV